MKEVLLGIILGLITAGASILVAKIGARATTRAATTGPDYIKTVTERVDELEKKDAEKKRRIDELESKYDEVSDDRDNFAKALDDIKAIMRDFIAWYNQGATPPPPPIPAHLRDQVGDYELARITETTHTVTQTERTIYPEES